ncbi:MAG TPA: hypothetical protein ENO21_04380 [Firmicutes bacterium]|nr:hypothetical protein [Bacillota bacterium]
MPLAASLADAIKGEFGCDVQLTPGSGGILDIVVDGTMIFSKHKAGYKPSPEEIVGLLNGG